MSFELLKSLADAHGVSGREGEVRDVIRAALAGMGLSAEEDALGNLFVEAGGDPAGPPVLLDAHMDEIGLMVSHISPWGQLSFATMGGWDARNLPAQEVTIRAKKGKVAGVIGSKPPHILKGDESSKAWSVESLWIDVGAMSEAETRDLGIEVGDPVVLDGHCAQLREGLIRGKALDDRVGCYVILETLRVLRSEKLPIRLCASFTTSEEVGLRGIGVIGRRADWAAALLLEATVAGDVPGVAPAQCPSRFGKGPVITVADRSTIVPERMVDFLESVAGEHKIPHQRKTPIFGGTNAGTLHQTGKGVLCGIIAAPCRYIHSPVTLLRTSDLDAMIKLTTEAVRAMPRLV
ncbi:M42 family metallopeptidase [Candidatus Sumerlaeota bacterium]|nr:M42 family metallopeptidase [Candidatus Sumerlaeota bacterium]